jgi:hypothetical protein
MAQIQTGPIGPTRMTSKLLITTAAAALVAGATLVATPAAAYCDYCQIQTILADMCLQPVNGSTTQGASIVLEPCNNGAAQQWTKVPVSGNIVHFVNVLSGLCLDARGGATNHTPVQQWPCNWISNEKWEPGDASDDIIPPLFSRVSGTKSYCLDVPGAQVIAGLPVQIYRCNGTEAQMWFTP